MSNTEQAEPEEQEESTEDHNARVMDEMSDAERSRHECLNTGNH